jgi:murein DD-endopeptidase MepM/ murein hydrolase activator NlpD
MTNDSNLQIRRMLLISLAVCVLFLMGYLAFRYVVNSQAGGTFDRTTMVWEWLRHPEKHPDWAIQAGKRCGQAPFLLPTDGFIGYLWDDSFRPGNRHQGLDIFSGTEVNKTPVVAASAGYLTRLPEWKSAVVIRIPSDPLKPDRQIWTYYTHMAGPNGNSFVSPKFPPGTSEVYVEAGTLLGYQGNYSGTPGNPVGVHLHFSIVRDDDNGKFLNELKIENTLDPSSYLGLTLNARQNPGEIPLCLDTQP